MVFSDLLKSLCGEGPGFHLTDEAQVPGGPVTDHSAGEGQIQDVNLILLIPKVKLSMTLTGLSFGSLNSVS